jgi:hypothetical protein
MASGNGGKIATSKIGSLYADVNSVNAFFGFTDETLEHKLDELEEGAITGFRDAPNSFKGLDHGTGDINFEPNPDAFGHVLNAWFGVHSPTVVTAATSTGANSGTFAGLAQTRHRFTPSNVAFSDRTFLAPYNVGVYRDVQSAWIFKGAIFPSVKLMFKANQLVKATATIMARDVGLLDYTAGMNSIPVTPGKPWVWDMASVEYSADTTSAGLAAITAFEEFNITFDLPHDGVPLLDGTKKYAEFVPSDFRRIKVDGSMSFRDEDTYTAFKNYEQHRMRLTALNVSSVLLLGNPASADASAFVGYPGLRIHMPALKFTSWSAPIKGPNRIVASFNAKLERSLAEGFSCAVDLLNSTDASVYDTAI